ncbi:MAG: branched-subunit amino acid transport protein [Pseudohongiellaceae bacterium]|jgi:branched-subunit amino acid transport protein
MNEWVLIIGMMLVTFIPRYLPLAMVHRFNLSPSFVRSLSYIPVAVLSTIVAQHIFFIDNVLVTSLDNNRLIVGLLAMLVALVSKSLWWTVIVGLVIFVLLERVLPIFI